MVETYYDRLGVEPDAGREEIRAAYRERLKETHPDVSERPDAGRRTQRLIEARDVLTDETERQRYDRLGHEDYLAESTVVDAATANTETTGDADSDESATSSSPGATTVGSAGPSAHEDTSVAGSAGGTARASDEHSVDGVSWQNTQRGQAAQQARGPYATATGGEWRAWDSDRSYSIGGDGGHGGFLASRRIPDNRTLLTIVVIFFVYPVLVWGTILPAFPLAFNAVMGALAVLLVAFLQSMPTAAVAVFGFWTVFLPVLLVTGFGVGLTSLVGMAMVLGMVLPLGFSLLTRSIVRY